VFIGGAIVMTAASGALAEQNKEVADQLTKQSAEKYAMWVLLASVFTFLLGCFGVMPWTGSGKKKTPPPPPPPDIHGGIFTR
jgi:hypothetical protein